MSQPLANLTPKQLRAAWNAMAQYVENGDEAVSLGVDVPDLEEAREVLGMLDNFIANGAYDVIVNRAYTSWDDMINKGIANGVSK